MKLLDLSKRIFHWVDVECPAWLNIVITSGAHGVILAGAGLVGYADHALVGYVVFKSDGPIGMLQRWVRGAPRLTGWRLVDSWCDVLVPFGVWLLFF